MKNTSILKRIAAVSLILFLSVGLTVQASSKSSSGTKSGTSSSKTKEAESTSLSDAEAEKKELEKQLADAKKLISNLKDSKGDVEANLAELNNKLMNISARITDLENQLAQKNLEIEHNKEELETAKQNASQQYEDMKLRIQYMYENSQTSYAERLLSSANVADFLNSAEYISQIEHYDRQKLEEYQDIIVQIEAIEAQLEQDYADLQVMKADVEAEKKSVASLMAMRETELAEIKDDISDAQEDAKYYEAEIQAQEELIAEIKRLEAEKAAAGLADNPYSGGAFTWPCPSSTRITSDYGPRKSPTAGASSNHKGIDIGASYGADIVAAAPGTVKASAYSSTGGNYVMIDHGGGLYTVYMHASSLVVSKGDTVTAGQVIAKVGSTGISTGNHLHFGVSLNGSYVSPWGYLGN